MSLTLANVRALGDPLRSYNYDLIIPSVPGSGDGEALRLNLLNTSIPGFSSEAIERAHHGFIIKEAGRGMHPRVLPAEYVESSDLAILKALKAWHGLQWETETGIQAPSDVYKTDAYLQLMNNAKEITGTINLRGVFIEDVGDTALDSSSSDIVRVAVSFSYDDWVIE